MTTLAIGQRLPLSQININPNSPVALKFSLTSAIEMDISCFALDTAGKLISDDYMIFYNQTMSPCGHLKSTNYSPDKQATKNLQADFEVSLSKLSANIDSIFFVMSSDARLNLLQSLQLVVEQQGVKAQANYLPVDFEDQQASMLVQLYRKNGEWRVANVAQGFNGGLASIVRHFGGDVEGDNEVEPKYATSHNTPSLSLENLISTKAPKLINLAKKANFSLEKRQLQNLTAKVALVLDGTGSMNGQYKKGFVQEVVDRLVPLGVVFDDDQAIDCWAFGEKSHYLGEVTLDNYEDFVDKAHGGWRKWNLGSRVNNEAAVIDAVTRFYEGDGLDVPVYVLFISDGGVHDTRGITKMITKAANLPIFWQFVGLGGYSYGVFKKLDNMTGRVIDNCNFFELDSLSDISEEQLYDNMLEEFPDWLKEAKTKNIIKS